MSENYYSGAHEVETPLENKVVLETAGLKMKDDITVKKVQFAEVSNDAGGTTVYIGKEI